MHGNKGKKRTPEQIERMRVARTGIPHTQKTKDRISAKLKGKVFSEDTRRKISESKKGIVKSHEWREKIRLSKVDKPNSIESKLKVSLALKGRVRSKEHRLNQSGDKHWNWKGGITPKNRVIRNSLEAKLWRKSVFERDNYTCIWCSTRGGRLHADHIKQFAFYPELRFAIDNGRTLCEPCHRTTETFGRQKI